MAQQTRGNQPSASSSTDQETAASVKKWRERFGVQRPRIGATTVNEDLAQLPGFLRGWPAYDHGTDEHTEASKLKRTIDSTATDADLSPKLANMLEQVDRHVIIGQAFGFGYLGARSALGIIAGGRLEAICLWQILTGTGKVQQERDANFWREGWKKTLYVSELTSAPWNVGWPTLQAGVSGAGTALIDALKAKGKETGCDGIGLIGLAYNLGFYQNTGFTVSGLKCTMDLHG